MNLNPEGPHDPDNTEAVAELILEATRFLVYASMPERARRGLKYPGTVYGVLGSLSATAYRSDQLFRQITEFLRDEADADRLRRDGGGSVSDRITTAVTQLNRARQAAAALEQALANAQAAIDDLGARDDT